MKDAIDGRGGIQKPTAKNRTTNTALSEQLLTNPLTVDGGNKNPEATMAIATRRETTKPGPESKSVKRSLRRSKLNNFIPGTKGAGIRR